MILIADSTGNLSQLLKQCTARVQRHVNCSSFEAALESLRHLDVRMAIVAQNLADRHGFELLSHLAFHFPTLPVIFVADDSRKETIISAMRRGARDFLEWPFDTSDLLNAIRRITALSSVRASPDAEPGDMNIAGDIRGEDGRSPSPNTPYRRHDIEAFFLGTFQVTIAGQPLRHWTSRKGKSLFAFLLYNDSKPIFREVLLEMFWPKIFPESARNCLNVTIHHIRQKIQGTAIQKDVVLLSNDCYLINPELRIASDVKHFLSHWNRSRFLQLDNRPGSAMTELELAASVYKSDFMIDEISEEWVLPQREKLCDIYLEVLENLSRIYSLNGKPKTAIEICSAILERDDCREKIHRRLMLCYHRIGNRDQALRQFHKCSWILKRELDVKPSSKTIELYKKIRDDTPLFYSKD
jgi:DNA-binding SARP family transcriptional activator/ActR/RegA family two-component response regulator